MSPETKNLLETVELAPRTRSTKPRIERVLPNGVFVSTAYETEGMMNKIRSLCGPISEKIGHSCGIDGPVQDSNHTAEIYVANVLSVRFSRYGDLFAIRVHEDVLDIYSEKIAPIVEAKGYVYVRIDDLDESYSGANPKYIGRTWWDRFFDYM